MMNRCYTPTNKDYYGGRIVVCPEWHEFQQFLRDVGEKPGDDYVLTRYDEEDHFHPRNVRWWPRHKRTGTKVYQAWKGMLTRCGLMGRTHQSVEKYAAKGISVCERWWTFDNFLVDMGDPPTALHSLDRIDGTGNYEPENCRWATREEQASNRCDNVLVEFGGKTQTLSQWARETGIPRTRLQTRYTAGHRGDKLFTKDRMIRRQSMVVMLSGGAEIARFATTKAAAATTGLSYSAISKCLSGGNKTCGGYEWRYDD